MNQKTVNNKNNNNNSNNVMDTEGLYRNNSNGVSDGTKATTARRGRKLVDYSKRGNSDNEERLSLVRKKKTTVDGDEQLARFKKTIQDGKITRVRHTTSTDKGKERIQLPSLRSAEVSLDELMSRFASVNQDKKDSNTQAKEEEVEFYLKVESEHVRALRKAHRSNQNHSYLRDLLYDDHFDGQTNPALVRFQQQNATTEAHVPSVVEIVNRRRRVSARRSRTRSMPSSFTITQELDEEFHDVETAPLRRNSALGSSSSHLEA